MGNRGWAVEGQTDDLLLAGFGTGDPTLSVAFVRRYQRAVFGVAVGVIRDARLAEDVAQQAFERAWRHAPLYDARRGTVGAWLTGITHNLAVDAVRGRRPSPVDPGDLEALLAAVTRTPEGDALAAESAAELRTALAGLPEPQARALAMAAFRGMTAREVAAAEGIPVGTAKTRIRTAMLRLHAALEPGRADHD